MPRTLLIECNSTAERIVAISNEEPFIEFRLALIAADTSRRNINFGSAFVCTHVCATSRSKPACLSELLWGLLLRSTSPQRVIGLRSQNRKHTGTHAA